MKFNTTPFSPLFLGIVLALAALSFNLSEPSYVQTYNDGSILIVNDDYLPIKLKKIPAGTFTMGVGSSSNISTINERPQHSVTLKLFAIGKTEVTQELYQQVMGNNPSYTKGKDLPVTNVSWNDVQDFLRKINATRPETRSGGVTYRLPTEAEWEYAARGGNNWSSYEFTGSNDADEVAWFAQNSDQMIHPVGTKAALNPANFELYDMSGNVSEWVQDKYSDYLSIEQDNPCVTEGPEVYVIRGGSFRSPKDRVRITARDADTATYRAIDLGFRLACDLKDE